MNHLRDFLIWILTLAGSFVGSIGLLFKGLSNEKVLGIMFIIALSYAIYVLFFVRADRNEKIEKIVPAFLSFFGAVLAISTHPSTQHTGN